ncbi:MAG TPA: LCP family protein [Acidimicrobiales bacterium]
MSPLNPENDPVHQGLHDLGRQIDNADSVPAAEDSGGEGPMPADAGSRSDPPTPPEATGADAGADDEMPWPAAAPAAAAQMHAQPDPPHVGAEGAAAPAASPVDPADNPVERGLHELGRQIEESERGGARGGGGGGDRGGRGTGSGGPAHAAPKERRSTRRKVVYVLGSLFLVLVLVAGAAAGYGWYLNREIHHIDLHNLTSAPGKGADAGTENILMIGSTSRCALKVQNPQFGLCSQGVTGVNSDVVMLLHLNPAKNKVSILSIPRDLFVPNARSDGANKIDAALYQGPDQLISAVEEDLGIPIQHFVELNFDSFMNVVNALGGIHMYFPEPIFDSFSGLDIRTTGCIGLNGTSALEVVRARHLQYKPPGVTTTDPYYWPKENESDLARIRRNHEFLRVLASAVKAKGLGNPLTDNALVSGVVGDLTVDSGFSATDMISLVLTYHNVNVNKAPQLTVPVQVDQFGDYVYQGGSYGDIEFPTEPQDHAAVDRFLGLKANEDTYSGGALPSPSSITVSVMNGSGTTNQASNTAASLKALGFNIGSLGDSTPVGREAETVVYYSKKTEANLAAAQAVANSMTGAVIMADDPSQVQPGSQVTVVTGTQFSVNPPPTAVTPTSAAGTTGAAGGSGAGSSSTTTPTTSAGSSASTGPFQAPTTTVEPLAPWDPRSCTATGGEGK